jgi:hypothetical protein
MRSSGTSLHVSACAAWTHANEDEAAVLLDAQLRQSG